MRALPQFAGRSPEPSAYAFACTLCGKCCNTGPQLTLPELLRHQRRFIGCLTLRYARRVRLGDALGDVKSGRRADADDVRASEQLAGQLWFTLRGPLSERARLMLTLQTFYSPEFGRCPELTAEGRCALEAEHKPGVCRAAPLEAWLPNRLQPLLLAQRAESTDYVEAQCIHPPRAGESALTRGHAVGDASAHALLAEQRRQLVNDKRYWGEAVFRELEKELWPSPESAPAVPFDGFVQMSPVPVLRALAQVSERCRARALECLAAQAELLEQRLLAADLTPASRLELSKLAGSAKAARPWLARLPVTASAEFAAEVEAWLSLSGET